MIKHIGVTLFLFAINISFAQELTATQKLPATVDANSEFTVEISINKGQMNGFMKFFQPLPEGFSASEIESKGGSFTFAENGVKIVWITPPGELTFTVSYKVKVPAKASGTKELGGKLSYIYNNQRKAFDFENKTITIANASVLAKAETPKTNTSTQPTVTTKTEVEKTETPKTNTTQPIETKKETSAITKSTTLPLSSKTPVTAIPSSPGKTYRVQVGAFNLKPKIAGVLEHTTVVLDNGMTKHFSGNFATYQEAAKRKKELIDKGFDGAFIVSFENGKIVK